MTTQNRRAIHKNKDHIVKVPGKKGKMKVKIVLDEQ